MIPTQLRLQGFLSYQQETTLDFSSLHVACISGMNGSGKSSLLDAITWCLFGEARQKNDALINLNTDDAFVELEFTYENNQYRILRARQREKSTQLDFQIKSQNTWKDLTERTLRATQERITNTLNMDYDTFINASFFLQGKSDQFARQTPGKRKEILTKILGLEKWETYKNQALQQRRNLEQQKRINDSLIEEKSLELNREQEYQTNLQALETQKQTLENNLTQQESILKIIQDQQKQIEQLQTQLHTKKQTLANLETTHQTLLEKINAKQAQLTENQTILAQKETIQTKYQTLTALQTQNQALIQTQNQISQLNNQKHSLELELTQKTAELKSKIALLQNQQQNISQNQATYQTNQTEIEQKQQQIATLQAKTADLNDLHQQKQSLEETITNLLAENKHLQTRMQELQTHIEQIQTLNSPTCPFCEQDLTPEHQTKLIAQNQTQGKQLGDQYRQNKQHVQDAQQALTELTTTIQQTQQNTQSLNLLEQQIQQLQQQNQTLEKTIAQNPAKEIETLQAQLQTGQIAPTITNQIEKINQKIDAFAYQPDQHKQIQADLAALRPIEQQFNTLQIALATQKEIQSSLNELTTQQQQIQTQITQTQAEQTQLQTALTTHLQEDDQNTTIQEKINQIQAEIKQIKQATYDNQLAIGGAKQALNNLTQIAQQKQTLATQNTTILAKIATLKEIEKSFSKEGIPALLIEQAIPEIESRANQILRKLTNDEMTISLITQEEYKDKTREDLKETMEIKVHDKFGTRDYELFSGGETFRINFALRLALSELLSKRAGAKLQTLVIDEGFGSQDEFGRQKLAEVINPIKEQFKLILVITHIDSLKDAFPNRILVEKTPQGSIATIN